MSQKLAVSRDTAGKSYLVDACVVPPRVAKSSNISAPNCAGSSEVLAVKQMNDIGVDALSMDIFTKISK
jgi:hypothetical protein